MPRLLSVRLTKKSAVQYLQNLAASLNRAPKAREVMVESCGISCSEVARVFGTFNAGLRAAGLALNKINGWKRDELIVQLKDYFKQHGRPPTANAWVADRRTPNFPAFKRVFGTWNNALKAAGFETKRSTKGQRRLLPLRELRRFALRSADRYDFATKYPNPDQVAQRRGLIDKLFRNHPNSANRSIRRNSKAWTFDKIAALAKRYKLRMHFQNDESEAYSLAQQEGWLDRLFEGHRANGYPPPRVHVRHWHNKSNCQAVAALCKTKKEFETRYRGAYKTSLALGWLDEICAHMAPQGNRKARFVYLIINRQTKTVYCGLSLNPQTRFQQHRLGGLKRVRALIAAGGKLRVVTDSPIPAEDAVEMEGALVRKYKEKGWTVLNAIKTGALGCSERKWTKSRLKALARECKTRRDMENRFPGAHGAACKQGVLDELFSRHPKRGYSMTPHGTWTIEKAQAIANKCKTRRRMRGRYPSAYGIVKNKGWMDEIFSGLPNNGYTRPCLVARLPKAK
jgi:predicted GIY-YIG superfamily endonuclease